MKFVIFNSILILNLYVFLMSLNEHNTRIKLASIIWSIDLRCPIKEVEVSEITEHSVEGALCIVFAVK